MTNPPIRKVMKMKINANAKINLTLDVCGKRDDGYHDVSMVMQEISFCDELEVNINDTGKITLNCNEETLGKPENTLTFRASKLFFDASQIKGGCDITLTQNIPMCAGLGAGSADAAAVLNSLNTLYGNPFTQTKLCELGKTLGADVPFCIVGGCMLAEGIGEILTPIENNMKKWVALIKPDIDISTVEAYQMMDSKDYPHPDNKAAIEALKNDDIEAFSKVALNCFDFVTSKIHPEIEAIKKYFYEKGCSFSMMSGSGPTVFALFDSFDDAKKAFDEYSGSFSGGGVGKFI